MSFSLSITCCSSSTQVLAPSEASGELKSKTFHTAVSLARQIQNINLDGKSKSQIRTINELVNDAKKLLAQTTSPRETMPSFARVAVLSALDLERLQKQMQDKQNGLVKHRIKIRASSKEIDDLFDSMERFKRELDLLDAYLKDNPDSLKMSISEPQLKNLIRLFKKSTVDQVLDERGLVSKSVIEKLSESDVRVLQRNENRCGERVKRFISEIISHSTIRRKLDSADPTIMSGDIFIPPVADDQSSSSDTPPMPPVGKAFTLTSGRARMYAMTSSPSLALNHPRLKRVRVKSDIDEINPEEISVSSRISPSQIASPSGSPRAEADELSGFPQTPMALPNFIPDNE